MVRIVRLPVESTTSKWVNGYTSQEVCPWNHRFARELPEGSPFAARELLRGKDARTLAAELLAMSQEEFSVGFRKSPMKRAKLRGLKRNAAVVLGNAGDHDNVDVPASALHPHRCSVAHAPGRACTGHLRASGHASTVSARIAVRKRASLQSGSKSGLQPIAPPLAM